jgi:membrane fusion protein, multidrug efflux system
MTFTKRFTILLIVTLAIFGCGKKADPKTMAKDDKLAVMVEELSLRPIDEYITVSGKLEGITDITMSSETAGRVLALYKKLGDRVGKGERIGMVENSAMQIRLEQAESAILSAQAAFENAQKNLNYAQESYNRKLISEAEYNSAVSAFKGAKAGLEGARAGKESARQAVDSSYLSAPASGIISNMSVAVGQFINMGVPLLSITDASTLILKTGVGESLIGKIKTGQAVIVSYPGLSETFSAKVRGFGIRPAMGSSAYPIEIQIPGTSKLLPGMVVKAKILSNRFEDLLYTPITNIMKEFGKNYIFVIDANNKAVKKEIQLGRIIGENVEILSGAEVGDRIVTSGIDNLEDGSIVQVRQ